MTRTRRIWVEGDKPGPLVVAVDPPLEPGEVEITFDLPRTVTPTIDEADLEVLLSRCRGGGVSERAATGASRLSVPQKDDRR